MPYPTFALASTDSRAVSYSILVKARLNAVLASRCRSSRVEGWEKALFRWPGGGVGFMIINDIIDKNG